MFQLSSIFVSLLILSATSALTAGDFCSLSVKVVSPTDGRALSDVLVGVRERSGRSAAEHTKDGIARFCGLGISTVDVTVGSDKRICSVVVQEVPLAWDLPVELKVVYNLRACEAVFGDHGTNGAGPLHCKALLRFFGEDGWPVNGVAVSGPGNQAVSDQYGRLMVAFRSDQDPHSETRKEGFLVQTIDLQCRYSGYVAEKLVTLKKPK